MRVPLILLLALLGTVGLTFFAIRERRGSPAEETVPEEVPTVVRKPEERELALRAYRTTATLAEDLRDALAGDAKKLNAEVWRVSGLLKGSARYTLSDVARKEASPRVRALLVLAAGVHHQDEELLFLSLDDPKAVVRQAAALALGYAAGGRIERAFLGDVRVPLGRKLPAASEQRLRRHLDREKDEDTRACVEAVVSRRR